MQQQKIATIFGATGFIGRYITQELAELGYTIRVASRNPNKAFFLKPYGDVGQVVSMPFDGSEDSIKTLVSGAELVVNCVGILYETKRAKFDKTHTDLPEMIAKAAKKEKTERLIHISALGCDQSTSKYAASKLAGEKALKKAFPKAVILRPSVVFGPEDDFFNMFARLGRVLPVLPLIGGGKTRFQPVCVFDIAEAVKIMAAAGAGAFKDKFAGNLFELGGPDIVSFKDIYAKLKQHSGIKFCAVYLPWGIAKVEAVFLSMLPKPLLTPDQVESLKTDNVVGAKAKTFADIGISPKSLDAVLPSYLGKYHYTPPAQENEAA